MKRQLDLSGQEDAQLPLPKKPNLNSSIESRFRADLFESSTLEEYTKEYAQSVPYKHAVISSLIDPSLLRSVREEIISNLHFTAKETDIYKIHQTGDLANLDGLDDSSLSKLPSLLSLRDALYSPQFREHVSHITGAGKLSGRKTDMAINVYTPGCHLLCHDDVIGSRRVSYILYLTDPDKPWKAEWGGALRLYPTTTKQTKDGDEIKVPNHTHSISIPPAFDQLSFFAVQPGESYHDVEEVYYGKTEEENQERTRMAISGWYHIPQEGEDGYEAGLEDHLAVKSSLRQLEGQNDEFDIPQKKVVSWDAEQETNGGSKGKIAATEDEEDDDADLLTEKELEFLLKYISPSFLTPDMAEQLETSFTENSFLQIDRFLNDKFSEGVRGDIKAQELSPFPPVWPIAEPPFKHRYCFLQQTRPFMATRDTVMEELVQVLFPSHAFRKWLAISTGLDPSNLISHNILARRFRRGQDYALASGFEGDNTNETQVDASQPSDPDDDEDGTMRLEFTLNMTPTTGWEPPTTEDEEEDEEDTNATRSNGQKSNGKPQSQDGPDIQDPSEFDSPGGEEVYMAANEDDSASLTSQPNGSKSKPKSDPAVYKSSKNADNDEEEENDGILLSNPPSWNTLSIVLRDKGTLRFVKYVSRNAPGDRWDVKGEIGCFGVGGHDDASVVDDDDDEDDEDDDEEADDDQGNGEEEDYDPDES